MSTTSQSNTSIPAAPPAAPAGVPLVQRDFSNLVVSPAIQRSMDAFRSALPELLNSKTDDQEWVAFSGDDLVCFGRTKTETYEECFRRGLKFGTFIVWSIEPAALDREIVVASP